MVPVDNFVFAVSGLNSVAIVCKYRYIFKKKQIKINHDHVLEIEFQKIQFLLCSPHLLFVYL